MRRQQVVIGVVDHLLAVPDGHPAAHLDSSPRFDAGYRPPAQPDQLHALGRSHHGAAFAVRVMPKGKLSATIIVLVNGQSVVHLDRLDTPLEPEDTVAFFPMIAGG